MTKRSTNRGEHVDVNAVPWWTSKRLLLAILGFFGFINVYALRVNMSVAIVCMVNKTAIASPDDKEQTNETVGKTINPSSCGLISADANASLTSSSVDGEFVWDKTIQGHILGAFFYGYLVTQIPGGWVATKFGGKLVYGISMLLASIITLLTPLAAESSYIFLIVLRAILGICSGVVFPAMHALWGNWAPPQERSKLTAFTYAGAQVGNVITFPLSGLLCKYGFANGWPSIFYVLGISSFVWVILWMIFASNSPSEHKSISEIEKKYILQELAIVKHAESKEKKLDVPWIKIFTSIPVYAIIIVNVTSDWGAYTLLTNIPSYMSEVLKFDIASNGLYSALPYIVFWALITFGGWLADFMGKKCFNWTVTRKIVNTTGMLIPALMMIGLGYVDCGNPILAMVLLTLAVGVTGLQYSGWLVNHVDIAPPFAGIIFGISNSIASVTGFIAPAVVGIVTKESQSREQWQVVFYIAAGMYTLGALSFLFLGSGELQSWAMEKPNKDVEIAVLDGLVADSDKKETDQDGVESSLLDHHTSQV